MVIAPDYIKSRIKGGAFPAGLEDCYTTLQYISTHKEELGISNQIAVTGDSGGGQMAFALALLAEVCIESYCEDPCILILLAEANDC